MHLFRVHRLPLFQAPDAPPAAAGDPPPADPVASSAPPPAADPAPETPPAPPATDPSPETPPAPSATDEPKPHGNKGRKPWYLDRISEESEARRQAEQRAREAEELISRLQKNPNDPATPPAPQQNQDVETRAQQIAEERLNQNRIRDVVSAGVAKFSDWDQRAEMLAAVGAASPAFVLDVATVDATNAHEILHQLADDPNKAARLAKMDTRSRTIELVKMSMALNKTEPPAPAAPPAPPKSVSKAPPPPPPLEPAAKKTVPWWDDSVSDADFSRQWDENARQRAQRGRR